MWNVLLIVPLKMTKHELMKSHYLTIQVHINKSIKIFITQYNFIEKQDISISYWDFKLNLCYIDGSGLGKLKLNCTN